MRTPLYAAAAFTILTHAALLADDPPGFVVQPGATTPPEQTVKQMKVPDGFKVKVFAAEPDIVQPIAFAIDDRGRLWVCENLSYPDWKPEGQDRIVILEDTDGDGHFDKKTLFYDKLNNVSAIEVGFGGVFVGSNPHLLFIPDRDGDDVPDNKPEVLLDGWEHQDMHEILNSFNWGPDGWLYGTQGIFTESLVGAPGTPKEQRVPFNAGVWRYHPTKKKFEAFAQGSSNPWGVDFNDYGQAFITACVIPHLYHVIQGGLYQRQAGKHYNAYAYDDIKTIARHRHYGTGDGMKGSRLGDDTTDAAGGGHAHCGALVYLADQFPASYRNSIFMNNIHGNRMNNDSLTPFGSGYIGDRLPDFMLSGDKWYRGLAIRQGPDGSIFVSDWYDARACHQQKPHDRTNGRIYKISYGDVKQPAINIGKLTAEELVKLQLDRNDWFVRHARRVLQERGANPEVEKALLAILEDKKREVPQRLRALWALHAIGAVNPQLAEELLGNSEPYLVAWTIQLIFEDGAPADALMQKVALLAERSESPIVRRYIASALQRIPLERRWSLLQLLVAHPDDSSDPNLPMLLWYAAEPCVGADPVRAAELLGACKIGKLQEFIARRMASSRR